MSEKEFSNVVVNPHLLLLFCVGLNLRSLMAMLTAISFLKWQALKVSLGGVHGADLFRNGLVVRQLNLFALEAFATAGSASVCSDRGGLGAVASQPGRYGVAGMSECRGHLGAIFGVVTLALRALLRRGVVSTGFADVFGWFTYGCAGHVGGLHIRKRLPLHCLSLERFL